MPNSSARGLLIVGFSLCDIRGDIMGIDDAQLVQRQRLVGTLFVLPGQVECLAGVLPGLLAASRQPTDLAEPGDPQGMILPRAHADVFPARFLQQREPLYETSLEPIGIA